MASFDSHLISSVYVAVMAGGSGTRFWPASRAHKPKQFLPLAQYHSASSSLLAATVARLHEFVPPDRILIVTSSSLVAATRQELPEIPLENILAEPAPRNTAPCIGWASQVILQRDVNAQIVVLPSDHHIAHTTKFLEVLQIALKASQHRPLVTIGIKPTRPDTGFGYIEISNLINDSLTYEVARFVEKPNEQRALEFLESGKFLWNSGIFVFRAQSMLNAIEKYLPELSQGLHSIAQNPNALEQIFPTLPSISIDYGIVERMAADETMPRIGVVPGDFGWSDVGSWQSAWDLAHKDHNGNALPEDAITVDSHGNFVRCNPRKTVALLGVQDLVIVETEDALLVMPKQRSQDVRLIVEELKSKRRTERL